MSIGRPLFLSPSALASASGGGASASGVWVLSTQPSRAEAVARQLPLRSEAVVALSLVEAEARVKQERPLLSLIDVTSATDRTWLKTWISQVGPTIIVADGYDENLFLACHDLGLVDYVLASLGDAYLLSRVIHALSALQERQLQSVYETLLAEHDVISERSGVFSTSFFYRALKTETEQQVLFPDRPLSLLMVELSGYPKPLTQELAVRIYRKAASVMKAQVRNQDWIFECLEDKFAVLMPGTSMDGAHALSRRIMPQLTQQQFAYQGHVLSLKARIAAADYSGCRDYEEFLEKVLRQFRT